MTDLDGLARAVQNGLRLGGMEATVGDDGNGGLIVVVHEDDLDRARRAVESMNGASDIECPVAFQSV